MLTDQADGEGCALETGWHVSADEPGIDRDRSTREKRGDQTWYLVGEVQPLRDIDKKLEVTSIESKVAAGKLNQAQRFKKAVDMRRKA